MSSSPSVIVENQESPPAPTDQAAPNSGNSTSNSNNGTSSSNTSPANTSNTTASTSNNSSESKVPPPLLQPHKSSNSSHRRRINSNQQQPPVFPAPFVDQVVAYNPSYYPGMYSYGTDFGADLWNGTGAGAFVDPAMWNGTIQSPNDIVFAYPPQFPGFGFASPDALTAQPLGGPSFTYDIPAGGLQPTQPPGGQTSPMMNGAFTESLQQRLREITLSSSDMGPNDEKPESQNTSGAKSSQEDTASSRTWANIASAQSPQSQQHSSSNAWTPAGGQRMSGNLRGPVVLDVGRSSTEPPDQMFDRGNRGPHPGGLLPYNAMSRGDDQLSRRGNYGGAFEPKPMYNAQQSPQAQSQIAVELCRKNDYNPKEFKLDTNNAKFFIIKSFAEDDVFASVKNSVWCSTVRGNERLHRAFNSSQGPIYLFYSVNNTGNFCGVAQMMTPVDFQKDAGCWSQPRWKGLFTVKWIYIKDIPFREFKEITLENNEGKPVFKSRDTQEVLPPELGVKMLSIFHNYRSQTTLFDDFSYYEEKAQAGAALQQAHISQQHNGTK